MVVQNSILRRPMQNFMIFLMKVTEDAVSLLFTWLIKADHFSPKVGQIYIEGIICIPKRPCMFCLFDRY